MGMRGGSTLGGCGHSTGVMVMSPKLGRERVPSLLRSPGTNTAHAPGVALTGAAQSPRTPLLPLDLGPAGHTSISSGAKPLELGRAGAQCYKPVRCLGFIGWESHLSLVLLSKVVPAIILLCSLVSVLLWVCHSSHHKHGACLSAWLAVGHTPEPGLCVGTRVCGVRSWLF